MRPIVYLQHVLHGELRITLGSSQALMTEQFLDRAQVGAFFQHVRPEGMPQRVRMHIG